MRRRFYNMMVESQSEPLLGVAPEVEGRPKKTLLCAGTKRRLYILFLLIICALIWIIISTKLLRVQIPLPKTLQKLRDMFGEGVVKKRRGREDETEVIHTENYSKYSACFPQFKTVRSKSYVHILITACGKQSVQLGIVALKSITITTNANVFFHIFTDAKSSFEKELVQWPSWSGKWMMFTTYDAKYPHSINERVWKNIFKPCSSLYLFAPDLLYSLDAIISIDVDLLVLSPIENLWSEFSNFDSNQLFSSAAECDTSFKCFYNEDMKRHPFYKPYGLNSGVVLMNLTRMRTKSWLQICDRVYQKYQSNLTFGDQDILNVISSQKPSLFRLLPCNWNFRSDFCLFGNYCSVASENQVSILHGSRGLFVNWKLEPSFYALYSIIKDFNFNTGHIVKDITWLFHSKLRNLKKVTNCSQYLIHSVFQNKGCFPEGS